MDHQILKRYFQGKLSEQERAEVEKWLERSEDLPHGAPYEAQVKVDLWNDIVQRTNGEPKLSKKYLWRFVAVAAMLLLTVGVIIGLSYRRERIIEWKEVQVPHGKRMQLRLANDTEVLLSGGSAIAYSVQGNGRQAALRYLKGEIYVSVKPELHRPFEVQLPEKERILVLGTAFNIDTKSTSNQLKVTLVTGKIRFEDRDSKAYILQPGQQLVRSKDEAIQIQMVNIDQEIAWKNQLLWFDDLPVTEVFKRLEREYGVDIETTSTVGDIRVTAKFRRVPLDRVLRLLEESTKIHFRRTGNKVIAF